MENTELLIKKKETQVSQEMEIETRTTPHLNLVDIFYPGMIAYISSCSLAGHKTRSNHKKCGETVPFVFTLLSERYTHGFNIKKYNKRRPKSFALHRHVLIGFQQF